VHTDAGEPNFVVVPIDALDATHTRGALIILIYYIDSAAGYHLLAKLDRFLQRLGLRLIFAPGCPVFLLQECRKFEGLLPGHPPLVPLGKPAALWIVTNTDDTTLLLTHCTDASGATDTPGSLLRILLGSRLLGHRAVLRAHQLRGYQPVALHTVFSMFSDSDSRLAFFRLLELPGLLGVNSDVEFQGTLLLVFVFALLLLPRLRSKANLGAPCPCPRLRARFWRRLRAHPFGTTLLDSLWA